MTNKQIKIIVLSSGKPLIAEIEEFVPPEIGDPDWKLTNPYEILEDCNLKPWLNYATDQTEFIIISDTIFTVVEPQKNILDQYLKLIN